MEKGLLVIDMQNICVGKNSSKFFKYDKRTLIDNVNSIIELYDSENVFYIKNILKPPEKLGGFFSFDMLWRQIQTLLLSALLFALSSESGW